MDNFQKITELPLPEKLSDDAHIVITQPETGEGDALEESVRRIPISDVVAHVKKKNSDLEPYLIKQSVLFNDTGYVDTNGEIVPEEGYINTGYVDVKAFDMAQYSGIIFAPSYNIAFYDTNKVFMRDSSAFGGSSITMIEIPEGAKYVIACAFDRINPPPQLILYGSENLNDKMDQMRTELDGDIAELEGNLSAADAKLGGDIDNLEACLARAEAVPFDLAGRIDSDGNVVNPEMFVRTDFVDLEGVVKLHYEGILPSAYYQISFYDAAKVLLPDVSISGTGAGVRADAEIPEGAKYVISLSFTTTVQPFPSLTVYRTANAFDEMDEKLKNITPSIKENGNWFIGDTDTSVKAQGPKGDTGATGPQGNDYVLTSTDKQEIADIVANEIINPLETLIDESGVL